MNLLSKNYDKPMRIILEPIVYSPSMKVTNRFYNSKTKTVTLFSQRIATTKTAEQSSSIKWCYIACSSVAYSQLIVLHKNTNFSTVRFGMTNGIDNKILQQTFQKNRIGMKQKMAVCPVVVNTQSSFLPQHTVQWQYPGY